MRKRTKPWPLPALWLFLCAVAMPGRSLESYMAIEIGRLEEARRVLQRFAHEVWPGWDNYRDVEFRFLFPNQAQMAVNPPAPPEGFEPVQGHSAGCGPVYVDRRRQEPGALSGTLQGGGGGGMQVRIRLRAVPGSPPGIGDRQILLYVHELFHGFQSKVMSVATDDALYNYLVGAEYAALCEVEGTALERARLEPDADLARECLLDYYLARQHKRSFIPAAVAAAEENIAVSEGTATYAALKMAELIRGSRYRPRLSRKLDPSFAGFRALGQYVEEGMNEEPRAERAQTFDTIAKYYSFGAQLCFLLDRFRPGWKNGFFPGGRSLDALVAGCLHEAVPGPEEISSRLERRYGWKRILARHAAAVAERDAAVAQLSQRRGRAYIIDLSAIREFARPRIRGRHFGLPGVRIIYPDGIEGLVVGAVELAGSATPWQATGLFTLEWTADPAAGEDRDPEAAWEGKEGEDLLGLAYRTAGFTLKAPRARIQAEGTVTRILVLARRAP